MIDIETDGRALENVATLSGVSGGSLGIAAWIAARERADLGPKDRLEVLKQYLSSDFLSPLLGGLLFLDVPKALLGSAWFAARRDHVFEKALADRWMQVGKTDFFYRPWRRMCAQGFKEPPAVFFNATDVLTGAYFPISFTKIDLGSKIFDGAVFSLADTTLRDAPIAQVVHISARFPYVSPAAEVGIDAAAVAGKRLNKELHEKSEAQALSEMERERLQELVDSRVAELRKEGLLSRVGVLVDGGYFDNTGLEPTKAALQIFRRKRTDEARLARSAFKPYTSTPIILIHLSNDPGRTCVPLKANWQSELTARSRSYLEVAKTELRCLHEVQALERSLIPDPMQWLRVPIQTLMSAREAHSANQLAMVIEEARTLTSGPYGIGDFRKPAVNHLSVAYELRDLRNELLPLLRLQPTPDEIALQVRQAAALLESARNSLPADELQQFGERIADYERRSIERDRKLGCELPKASSPPLGWMLDKSSAAALDCLAIRATLRSAFGQIRAPQLPAEAFSKDNPYIPR
jgi:hypothetical protein